MKKLIIFLLLFSVLLAVPANAADDTSRAVIAADITQEQIIDVYKSFGIERGSVPEISITNEIERSYLSGLVPEDKLGTKSISSVLVTLTDEPLAVEIENIDWCTEAMYMGVCATVGIENASIQVVAPFPVSGTAALAGIYMAYEDMTGQSLGDDEKNAGIMELITTAELSDVLGASEAVTLVTELKLILDETKDLSDEELIKKIDSIASDYKITLSEEQSEKLKDMCRDLEKLDPDAIREKVEGVKKTLEKMGEFKDKAVSFWDALVNFFKAIAEFLTRMVSIFTD